MRLFRHPDRLPDDARGAVIALGNFDGVHLGHRAIITAARERARAAGVPHGLLTFEPHTRGFLRPDDPPFRLTPLRAKARLVEELGCDLLYVLHFDRAVAALSPSDFVADILHQALGIRHAVVGENFEFGHGRAGTRETLRTLCAAWDIGATALPPVALPGDPRPVSSTRIRDNLRAGEPLAAAALLGRAWEIEGRVEHGDERGRTIGFPTANIALGDYLRPRAGVYAVRVGVEGDETVVWHDGVANIGTRPTVAGTDLRLEAHLFGFDGDLYGRHLRVALMDWLRPEQKFAGLAALRGQIAADSEEAKRRLAMKRR